MEFTIQDKSAFDREINFVFSAAEVEQHLDEELSRLATSVRLPGFRPGKIPKKILESRFKEHLDGTLTTRFFKESYPKALAEHDLNPVDQPEINLGNLVRGQSFTYSATIQVYPKIEPTGYTGLSLLEPKVEITDTDVDKMVEEIRRSHGRFEAEANKSAALGDQVMMDFEGTIDGIPFEGGKGEKYLLELGSGRFIPGFEDQLVSAKAGETVMVNVTFPNDYGNKDLAGKNSQFKCFIHEVRVQVLPDANDELATKAGMAQGGIEQLRRSIRERLENDVKFKAKKKVEDAIYEALLKDNVFDIPSRLEERERQYMLEQIKRQYQTRGLDLSQLNLNDQQILDIFGQSAGKRVRIELLLSSIANKENIRVDEARVEEHLREMTQAFGEKAVEVRRMVREDKDRMEDLRHTVLQGMVVEWIIKNSTIVEQPSSLDELMGSDKENNAGLQE
ncbi:MAG: trigger factor [Magnetococcales bacterium]|nr:trigger factor [Magnetococcales bacterium]